MADGKEGGGGGGEKREGAPPGGSADGAPPFDMSALQSALGGGGAMGGGPDIMAMAQNLAADPAFAQIAQQLQGAMGGAAGAGGMPGMMPGMLPGMAPGQMADPSNYMSAMNDLMKNPAFMEMGQRMFESMSADPAMGRMLKTMTDPTARESLEAKIRDLKKDDPSLAAVIDEIEAGGPQAMMKYWQDPEALSKLGKGMEKVMQEHFQGSAEAGGAALEGENNGGEEEEEEEVIVHHAWEACQLGDPDALKELLEQDADKDGADEEGRSGLHFACGYGEIECAKVLLEAKAKVDVVDKNKNSPLHYAAGYGQLEACRLLVEAKADKALKNGDGHTALEIAKMNKQDEIMKLLE